MTDHRHVDTARLTLDIPHEDDLPELFAIHSDPRVWTHFPSLRHTSAQETEHMLGQWIDAWQRDGLGPWIARVRGRSTVLGYTGCTLRRGTFWNLGYRLAAETQGRGYATEAATLAVATATEVHPEIPVVAYLLEHNVASMKVAEKVGLTLQQQGPDAGNPDPDAVRLVYADRSLTASQLAATMH